MDSDNKLQSNSENSKEESIGYFNSARGSAIMILSRFERSDAYLEKLIDHEIRAKNFSQLDKSLLYEIVHGVIRWRWKLDYILTGFYHGDYMKCLNIVKNALRLALYQIMFLDKVPDSAAVNESVEIIKKIQGDKIAGIVNAVLRNITRNIDNIRYPDKDEDVSYHLSVMFSYPRWMVRKWLDRFGHEETEKLLEANNRKPDITIRLNSMKTDLNEIENELKKLDVNFQKSIIINQSLRLHLLKRDITTLDIFKLGKISVQDESASLAVVLASPEPGSRVLDICAAPGGKSFFCAEIMGDNGSITSIDKYSSKVKILEDSIARLGYKSITAMAGDAAKITFDEKFDLVIADVPCSGLGTIAKKPDIKWKREREDVVNIAKTQRKIIENAAEQVAPNGVLLYSTCTIEPEENQDVINWFLENHPEFSLDRAEKYIPVELTKDGFMQTFPHIHNIDGAFAARLIKSS